MDAAIFGLIVADCLAEPMDLRHPPCAGGLVALNSLTLTTGGNACNVATAMGKLGLKAAAAGVIGGGVLGRGLIEQMRRARIDKRCVFTFRAAPTTAAVVATESGD